MSAELSDLACASRTPLQDRVTGVVTIESPTPISHNGLTLRALGTVHPKLESRSAKDIDLCDVIIELLPAGRLPGGGAGQGVEVPFEFVLEPLPLRSLAETYHGVYVTVHYEVTAMLVLKSGLFEGMLDSLLGSNANKTIEGDCEFHVEVPEPAASAARRPPNPLDFEISPASLQNVKKQSLDVIPKFLIRGHLDRTNCSLNAPFTGSVTVVESETPIRSVDLQLVRAESILDPSTSSKIGREATEIQNLQIGDGDVARNMAIPIYMIFPRVFSCPSVLTDSFRIEFEVNVIVQFEGSYSVTENFPIVLYRGPG